MLPLYSWNFVLTVIFAVCWYRAASLEDDAPALVWAGLSVIISALIWLWLHWGLLAMFLGQVALLVGIGAFRIIRDRER